MISVLIRADATPDVGGGHVMRCVTLADELAARDCGVAFATLPGSDTVSPALARSRHGRIPVSSPVAGLPHERCDVAVIDSYALGADVETAAREVARRVVVIDDAPSRPHDCDLLVDMSLGRRVRDYEGLVPTGAQVLAGVDYAFLRPGFRRLRPASLARRGERRIERVLVSLGLTDFGGRTLEAAEAVLEALPGAAVDVVLGPAAASLDALRARAAGVARMKVHVDPPDLPALMGAADLAVGAPGTSSWERCCLGLPTLLIVLADNQSSNAAALEAAGAGILLDPRALADSIAAALRSLADEPARLAALSARASALCDGLGVVRAADAIMALLGERPYAER